MTDSSALPGTTVPDHRGRTGLDRTGLGLDRNPRVRVVDVELLAAGWHVLRRTTLEYRDDQGVWVRQQRETYDRGNGHPDGMLLETAAGLLDDDDPATAIRREAAEETGVQIGELQHVFDVYMSPGSVTERIHFFAAAYDASTRTGAGGGLEEEGEEIDVVELDIDMALGMIRDGRIQDAKTIMLLHWAVLEGPFPR